MKVTFMFERWDKYEEKLFDRGVQLITTITE